MISVTFGLSSGSTCTTPTPSSSGDEPRCTAGFLCIHIMSSLAALFLAASLAALGVFAAPQDRQSPLNSQLPLTN